MDILFFMRHAGYVRNFDSTIRKLSDNGHRVRVVFDQVDRKMSPAKAEAYIASMSEDHPNLSFQYFPRRKRQFSRLLGIYARSAMDYARYFDPRFAEAVKLRRRAAKHVPIGLWLLIRPFCRSETTRRMLLGVFKTVERSLPVHGRLIGFLREHNPHLVLVTPLLGLGSDMADYPKAARRLGLRTGLCVASWDNLTNKGIVHGDLDVVTVWNPAQQREAVDLHGLAPDRIAVTGAQPYDHWFVWRPTLSRAAFLRSVGLPDDRPFILYVCSSHFIAPDEAAFVRRWAAAIRASADEAVRTVSLLVRPHPQNIATFEKVDLSGIDNLAIYPKLGENPMDAEAKANYFHSLSYASLVVGINSSSMIEAGVIGRAVYTVLDEAFRDTQTGTLHFHLLTDVNGGLLTVARHLDEHVSHLADGLADPSPGEAKARAFVAAFVRPHGPEITGTGELVAAIERTADLPRLAPDRPSMTERLLTVVTVPLFSLLLVEEIGRWLYLRRGKLFRRAVQLSQTTLPTAARTVQDIVAMPMRSKFARRLWRRLKALRDRRAVQAQTRFERRSDDGSTVDSRHQDIAN